MGNWRDEYRRELAQYVLKNGTPVDRGGRNLYYGYIALDYGEQAKEVAAALDSGLLDLANVRIEESRWSEFAGTFADTGADFRHGVDAHFEIGDASYHYRLEESIGGIMVGLLGQS